MKKVQMCYVNNKLVGKKTERFKEGWGLFMCKVIHNVTNVWCQYETEDAGFNTIQDFTSKNRRLNN